MFEIRYKIMDPKIEKSKVNLVKIQGKQKRKEQAKKEENETYQISETNKIQKRICQTYFESCKKGLFLGQTLRMIFPNVSTYWDATPNC